MSQQPEPQADQQVPRPRVPASLISGPLGSGKTTLLRHILTHADRKFAVVMNEFGEIGIDGRVLAGRNVEITELDGGCVCCSLLGEFEAAVNEIIELVRPDWILVETTGVAEPDALAFDIQESLPQVRLDGVLTVMDADAMLAFPDLGHTTKMQVQAADTILLNKVDLVSPEQLLVLRQRLRQLNPRAEVIPTCRGQVEPSLILGLGGREPVEAPSHVHRSEYQSLVIHPPAPLERKCFEQVIAGIGPSVYRAKGFARLSEGTFLFNYVAGRWELEPFHATPPVLVFIGRDLSELEEKLAAQLEACRVPGE